MSWSVVILDDGSKHLHAFDDIAAGLFASLRELNISADDGVCTVPAAGIGRLRVPSGRWIVLGALRHPEYPLPYDTVVYNTEQVGSPWFTPATYALLRRHVVWDYSAANAWDLRCRGVDTNHVPFCWYPGLERAALRPEPPVYDVAFVGSLNPRRQALIDELDRRGRRIVVVDGDYGQRRDASLRASRVLLNVHYYDQGVHESARCMLAAANRLPVVSETSRDNETTPGIVEAPYDQLIDHVEFLLDSESARARVVQEQYAGVCGIAVRMSTYVRAAAGASEVPEPRLVLSMVSCDEPHLERALRSALITGIGAWCISYNGADAAAFEARVRAVLGELPGAVVERPWISYGHNRTEALRLAAKHGTHALILDADEVVECWPGVGWEWLASVDNDGWEVTETQGEIRGPKVRVVRLGAPWSYVGAVHELLDFEGGGGLIGAAPGIVIRNMRDGAGSMQAPDARYLSEAGMLRADVAATKDPRSQFYLAQSLDCAGQWIEAVVEYARRADMPNGFAEEAWVSLVRIGEIYTRRPGAEHLVPEAFLRAYQARPSRAEPLLYLGRWYRQRQEQHAAMLFLARASALPPPPDRLFVETSAHAGGWQVLDELSLCLAMLGAADKAEALTTAALTTAPDSQRARLQANLEIYARLAGNPVHAPG